MDTPIIVLICGCNKYLNSVKAAIQRMSDPNWTVISVIGVNPLNETVYNEAENILYLNVDDTYEYLPSKIYAAFEWCYKKWPDLKGIFKTDDDIIFESMSTFKNTIIQNTNVPYWGLHVESTTGDMLKPQRILDSFNDKTLTNIPYYTATYCWGAGYWVSNTAINHIVKYKLFFDNPGTEDNNMGYIVNKGGWKPVHIPIKWSQPTRIL